MKLPGHRPGLPGNEISFLLCPFDPAHRAGFAGHLPVRRSNAEATEEGHLSIFSQSTLHQRKKLLADIAASARYNFYYYTGLMILL
jgi:hypothetical protein